MKNTGNLNIEHYLNLKLVNLLKRLFLHTQYIFKGVVNKKKMIKGKITITILYKQVHRKHNFDK